MEENKTPVTEQPEEVKEPKEVKVPEVIEAKPVEQAPKVAEVQEEFDDELDALIKEAETRIEE